MNTCGAKTRNGSLCLNKKMANGRCRMHGGKSTGAPLSNNNSVKHGFYSDALFDDGERDLYSRAETGSVDDEIKLAKVKLFRYVRLSNSVNLQTMVDGALEVIQKQGEDMRGIPYDKRELKANAPDYADLIIKTLDLIRKLELARHQMNIKLPVGDGADDMAREDTFIKPDEPIPENPIL